MKIRGAKGFGDPGAIRGVSISQLMYNTTTAAIILNEEAGRTVSACVERKETKADMAGLSNEAF